MLEGGFRPLFLGAGAWAALAMALWIGALTGLLRLPTALAPVDWHVHAQLYGFVPAVVAGFLLTAVPNWTGRLLMGWPLLGLVAVWIAGRVAVTASAAIAPALVATIDLGLLVLMAAATGREIAAAKNWRNLPVLVAVVVLCIGNLVFHIEAADGMAPGDGGCGSVWR